MEDEEFWTTYISVTPEEDEDFARGRRRLRQRLREDSTVDRGPGEGDKMQMHLSPLVTPHAAAIILSDALNVVLKQPGK